MHNKFRGDNIVYSVLRDKAKEFAKAAVFLCRDMKSKHRESVLINQLLRSATLIGANLHEAQYAQGTKDFISKLEIAQKECYRLYRDRNCIHSCWFETIEKADRFIFESIGFKHSMRSNLFLGTFFYC